MLYVQPGHDARARRRRREEAADFDVVAHPHLIDIGLRDAELLGVDEREDRPAHGIEELRIVVAHEGRERFLGDLLREDREIVRLRSFGDHRLRELGRIGRHRVALACKECVFRFRTERGRERAQRQIAGAEIGLELRS